MKTQDFLTIVAEDNLNNGVLPPGMLSILEAINKTEEDIRNNYEIIKNKPNIYLCEIISIDIEKLVKSVNTFQNIMRQWCNGLTNRVVDVKINVMLSEIYFIEAENNKIKLRFEPNKYQGALERCAMPNINTFAYQAVAQLKRVLISETPEISQEIINNIISTSSKEVAKELYSEEQNSYANKKLIGIHDHYIELMQENDSSREFQILLTEQNKHLREQNESLKSIIQETQDQNKLLASQVTEIQHELRKMQDEQNKLISKLSTPQTQPNNSNSNSSSSWLFNPMRSNKK